MCFEEVISRKSRKSKQEMFWFHFQSLIKCEALATGGGSFSLSSHLTFCFVIISFRRYRFFWYNFTKKIKYLNKICMSKKSKRLNKRTAKVSILFHVLLIFHFILFTANDYSTTSVWFLRLHVGAYPCQLPSHDLHNFWLFRSISV